MATINMVPEFTADEAQPVQGVEEVVGQEQAEVKESAPEKEAEAALPAEIEAASPAAEVPKEEDVTPELEKAILGLQDERDKLLREVTALKGARREIRQEPLVQPSPDELRDVNPADVNLIDKVLRAKGFVTKDEAGKMFYESVKSDQINKFLEKYPEYKPENDPNDIHWGALQRELEDYRAPNDPHKFIKILEKAHQGIARQVPSVDLGLPAKRRQVEVASVGSGGSQRASEGKQFDPRHRMMLEQGGFTEEDIQRMESKL